MYSAGFNAHPTLILNGTPFSEFQVWSDVQKGQQQKNTNIKRQPDHLRQERRHPAWLELWS
jgi:hypothetical protein